MVMEYGMSDICGPRAFTAERSTFLQTGGVTGSDFSQATSEAIDREVKRILEESYRRVKAVIESKQGLLRHIAAILTVKEVIEGKEFVELIEKFEGRAPSIVEEKKDLTAALPGAPGMTFAPSAPESEKPASI